MLNLLALTIGNELLVKLLIKLVKVIVYIVLLEATTSFSLFLALIALGKSIYIGLLFRII